MVYGAVLVLLTMLIGGCGYRFVADSGTRLPSNQKVWVAYFENNTVYMNASVAMKRALFDQFAAMRGILAAGKPEDGDLVVEGKITGYGANVMSYTAADTAKEYRLIVTAEVIVRRKADGKNAKPFWKGTVSGWQDYPIAATIEQQRNNEDAALIVACRKLSQQVIWNMERNY